MLFAVASSLPTVTASIERLVLLLSFSIAALMPPLKSNLADVTGMLYASDLGNCAWR